MKRLGWLLSFCSLLVFASVPVGGAYQKSVWSGIVVANNVERPEPAPQQLSRFESTLKGLFGYNQFKLIGQNSRVLKAGDEDWEASSKHFTLRVNSKSATPNGYNLTLQLLKDSQLILETDATLTKESPVVIKGPQVGDGQLVLLLIIE